MNTLPFSTYPTLTFLFSIGYYFFLSLCDSSTSCCLPVFQDTPQSQKSFLLPVPEMFLPHSIPASFYLIYPISLGLQKFLEATFPLHFPPNLSMSLTGYCLVAKPCTTLLWPSGLEPVRILCPRDFPGENTRVGCHFFLQGAFLIQGWILGLQLSR